MTKMTLRATLTYAAGLACAITLSACGSADGDAAAGTTPTSPTTTTRAPATSTSPATSATTTSTPSTSAGRTLAITVKGSTVSPAPATVDLAVGESLTLTVTSDHEDTLHIHGFEVEKPLAPGKPTRVTVRGEQPGVYEVETHHPELRLLKIAVQ